MKKFLIFLDRVHFGWLGAAAAIALISFAAGFLEAGSYGQGPVPTYAVDPVKLTYSDCLYFSAVTFSSLGYGDFRPVGISRLLASIEVFTGLAFLGVAIARLSSARQSYYTARLFSSDAQTRLDKFSSGFDELRNDLGANSGSQHIQEIIGKSGARRVALLNYIKYETANGPFLEDVPVRAVRRVIRYLHLLMVAVLPHKEESQSSSYRQFFRNAALLAAVIDRSSKNKFLAKDCNRLLSIIEKAKSLPQSEPSA
jgi:hypothetical protein